MKERGFFYNFFPHSCIKCCAAFLIALTLMFGSVINVSAAGSPYMGELQLFGGGLNVGINMYANYLPDVNDVEYIHVNYKGSGGSAIGIATVPGAGYDGRLETYATFRRVTDPLADASSTNIDYWMSDISAPDGISVTAIIHERSTDYIKIKYMIEFDNYVAKSSDVHVSFTDNFSQDFYTTAAETNGTMQLIGDLFYTLNCTVSDWAGNLKEYSNPELMPGAEWVNVSVGTKIFNMLNSIDTRVLTFMQNVGTYFGSLTDHINFNFETLFQKMDADQDEQLAQDQQQHMEQSTQSSEQHKEQMEQSSEQHDEIINGFNVSNADKSEVDFTGTMVDTLDQVEEEIFYIAEAATNEAFELDFFDINSIDDLYYSFEFVSTWFTNFWEIGGFFTATLSLLLVIRFISFFFNLSR